MIISIVLFYRFVGKSEGKSVVTNVMLICFIAHNLLASVTLITCWVHLVVVPSVVQLTRVLLAAILIFKKRFHIFRKRDYEI